MKYFALLLALSAFLLPAKSRADEIDFNRDVRPILSDKCFHCHGPDEHNRKANLRFDTFEGAQRALKGERVDDTKFVQRITSTNPRKRMPPAEANFNRELSAKEVDVLKKWIAAGAKYAKHWSFEPPVQATLPDVVDPAWSQPIDRFIAARLVKAGLKPASRADKATLLRRATLDLTGLPPTPKDLEAFLKDESPNAYEKVVDRLLSSPHYGERMTLFWMDLARYGDSSVYHADGRRDMWGWRDGVIRSFNDNQRFDQFTIEQVAGDLIPNATVPQKVASGFNRNHATTDEGGAIAEEYRVDYVVDRVKTVSSTWLAVSLECSQCHDHKYDPISQREYYQFFAFFNNTKDAGMQARGGNAAPIVNVPDADAALLLAATQAARQAKEAELPKRRAAAKNSAEFHEWLAGQKKDAPPLHRAPDFFAPLDERAGYHLATSSTGQIAQANGPLTPGKRPGGNGLAFDGKTSLKFTAVDAFDVAQPFTLAVWVLVPAKGGGPVATTIDGGSGMQLTIDDFRPALWIKSDDPKKTLKVASIVKLVPGQWHHLVIRGDGSKTAAGIRIDIDAKQAATQIVEDRLKDAPAFVAGKSVLRVAEGAGKQKFVGSLDDLCFFRERFGDDEVARCATDPGRRLTASPQAQGDATTLDRFLRLNDSVYVKALYDLNQLASDERKLNSGATSVMIMEDNPQMRTTYILNRGQYDQPLKDKAVKPGVPAAFAALPKDAPENRLGLARWLVAPENPLTARVAVNRFWQIFFGEGLVRTTEDFGLQGEMPSHPELLDWLAVDFVKSGWDVKRALKQIVLSSTYCQDSRLAPKVREVDPENRLLSRGARIRLQGEFIRDGALFVSGLLVDKIGGRSVKPYQPPGVWEEVTLMTEKYVPDSGEKLYRRSMYTYWKRSAPHPAMATFDAPTREKCTGYRPRTNTPLQALVTLNDPQFVEAARAFAQRIMKNGGSEPRERVQFAFVHALGRPATDREIALVEKLLASQHTRFATDPKKADALLRVGESPRDAALSAIEHASWTVIASTIMNLDEFLVKN